MKTHHFFPLGLILALFVIPVQLRAQDEEGNLRPNQGSLTVHVDKSGAARVSLLLHVTVSDKEPLKRALAESWSFPVQFNHLDFGEEDSEETEQVYPLTFIIAESNRAFSHSGLKSSCRINLHQVEKVYAENATPEWLPEKNLFLQWQKEGDPEKETVHFVAVGERSIWLARRGIDSLQERLESWRNKLTDFPSTQAGPKSIVGPSFPVIASAPTITSFSPGAVLATAFQLACYALFVSYALRLTAWGMVYVAGAVVVGMLLDEVPKTLRKKPVVIIESFNPENYQAGSWSD